MTKLLQNFPQLQKHPFEYLTLFAILTAGLVFFFSFFAEPQLQRRVVYATAASYFLWSLYHHHRRGDLSPSIIAEYLLFALLGILLLTYTLF
ncbi:hypothetical protein KJ909_01690 [Patescibacteria group bacterium]|nr:hypothetical protein [Patescibacteria group bacterium]